MSALGILKVPSRLVAVQMSVAHGVVLEGTVSEGTHDQEALLGSLNRFEFDLFDSLLRLELGTHFPHLETELHAAFRGKEH